MASTEQLGIEWASLGIETTPSGKLFESGEPSEIAPKLNSIVYRLLAKRRETSEKLRTSLITRAIIEAFAATIEASSARPDLLKVADFINIGSHVEFAIFLNEQKNPETEIDLAVIADGLQEWEDISPLGLAKSVREAHKAHIITKHSLVAINLWMLDRMPEDGADSLKTTHFDKQYQAFMDQTST